MAKRQCRDGRALRAGTRKRYCALACVLLCALALPECLAAAGRAAQPKRARHRSREIGPGAVWKPSESKALELHRRCDQGEQCTSVMQSLGAPREAVAFAKVLADDGYGDGYMESFRDYGKVDLAQAFFPFRANDNWQYFLVNGTPSLVDVTDPELLKEVEEVDLPRNATYQSLLKRFPKLFVWESDNSFVSAKRTPDGGQQFTFDYNLNNADHADWTGYVARVAIAFSKAGRLQGAHLLRVAEQPRD